MNYEKAYKEALERAKGIHSFSSDIAEIKRMEQIFQELAESENERIRKVQLDYWRSVGGKEWHGVPVQEAIAWLEKQGEKSQFDKERLMEVAKPETFEEQIEHWQRMRDIAEKMVKELLEKQGKQKPTFSERYENIAQSEWFKRTHEGMSVSDEESKWSDEDEELLQHCCGAVAAADYYTLEDKEEMENWLKSLKQRILELWKDVNK